MRPTSLSLTLAALLASGALAAPEAEPVAPKDLAPEAAPSTEPGDHGSAEDEKIGSYLIGFQFGARLPDTIRHMVWEDFARGMKHAIDGKEPDVEMKRAQTAMMAFQKIVEAKEAKAEAEAEAKRAESAKLHRTAGDAFRKEFKAKQGVKETASGLLYEVLAAGEGDATPGPTDVVTVHYEGKLFDGETFDSSRTRGEPTDVPLDRVLPGWSEGVQLMKKGAKYRFVIPPELGYGDEGAGDKIPPGSTLDFTIELFGFKNAPDPMAGSGLSLPDGYGGHGPDDGHGH